MASAMDHRAVPLDVLREFALDQSERSSLRQVAAAIGLGRTTLQKFINAETTPHPRVRRQIALWYLANRETAQAAAPEEDWTTYRSALQLLVEGLPEERRAQAADELLDIIEDAVSRSGAAVPDWVPGLRTQHPRDKELGS
jgi:transcriptional regulator with XRE-family HTH domain